MTISRTPSHLTGPDRYWLYLSGVDSLVVADNSTLDITGNFTLSFLIQLVPDPLVPLNYIICTKGNPTNYSTGSICLDVEDGQLVVYLHDGIKSLVYKTDLAILNTSQVIMISVTWDNTDKILKVYKNGVEQLITIQTSDPNYYTSAASFTNINTNSDDFVFGQGTGKTGFKGKIVDVIYSSSVWDSSKIYSHYNPIKYTGQYPEYGTIVFSSDREPSGKYNLHTMNALGEDQVLLKTSAYDDTYPVYNSDGTKIFHYSTQLGGNGVAGIRKIEANGGNDLAVTLSSAYITDQDTIGAMVNSDYVIFSTAEGSRRYIWNTTSATSFSSSTAFGFSTEVGATASSEWHPTDSLKFILSGRTSSTVSQIKEFTVTSANTFTGLSSGTVLYSLTSSDDAAVTDLRYNKQGTKIIFSKRDSASDPYQVLIMDDNGGNVQQITNDTFDSRACCFNPGYSSEFTVNGGGNALIGSTLYNFLEDTWAVRYDVTGGSAPSGLVTGTTYYAKKEGGVEISLYPTLVDAQSETNKITIGSLGAGTHTLINIDGQKILYMQNSNGKWQLYTMNTDGTNKVNVSNNSYNDFTASWKL
jgi:hypothetical protein